MTSDFFSQNRVEWRMPLFGIEHFVIHIYVHVTFKLTPDHTFLLENDSGQYFITVEMYTIIYTKLPRFTNNNKARTTLSTNTRGLIYLQISKCDMV